MSSIRILRCHHRGKWVEDGQYMKYIGGQYVYFEEWDYDYANLIDLVGWITLAFDVPSGNVLEICWLHGGNKTSLDTDRDVLFMWEYARVDANRFTHIFVNWHKLDVISSDSSDDEKDSDENEGQEDYGYVKKKTTNLRSPPLLLPYYSEDKKDSGPSYKVKGKRVVREQEQQPTSIEVEELFTSTRVAGIAALLKATHRDWSPARIKSAMMTTSYVVDHNGKQLVDDSTGDLATVLHYGSGHIDPDGNGNVPREFGGCSMRFQGSRNTRT
ncbi:hypothetical protein IFM89_036863 [Coptis chinensis]|uniref:PB1-like domain-containing protein n=1 Tax=Coptis chinensis TaxID=261450 RepID=A0A835LNU7_9MAGN|nr:hypothetical protein IFM89_036863 [Coptis chinensis]